MLSALPVRIGVSVKLRRREAIWSGEISLLTGFGKEATPPPSPLAAKPANENAAVSCSEWTATNTARCSASLTTKRLQLLAAQGLLKGFRMVSGGRQMLGFALAVIGFIGSIIICALPNWRVTAFIGANIVTSQVIWEGLWMNCVTQSTGQMQCKVYDSLLALNQDLQAARALTVIAIIIGVFGIILGVVGGKCTNFVEDERQKCKVAIASGIVFIIAGLMVLIPVCWSAHTIIRDFYNPILTNPQRRELGASLYIGWATAALLFLGGGLLCSSCPPKENNYDVKYVKARSVESSKAYV